LLEVEEVYMLLRKYIYNESGKKKKTKDGVPEKKWELGRYKIKQL